MSNFYKIEGENEFAYFRANFNQLHRLLANDSDWAGKVSEINKNIGFVTAMEKFRTSIAGSQVVEKGNNYFVVRGSQMFFYRIEAVDARTSRIIPVGGMTDAVKILIPLQLLLLCIVGVVLTPLLYKLRKSKAENWSKYHLQAFCRYLEIQGTKPYGQKQTGEIKQ
jgi:hypothetical protein